MCSIGSCMTIPFDHYAPVTATILATTTGRNRYLFSKGYWKNSRRETHVLYLTVLVTNYRHCVTGNIVCLVQMTHHYMPITMLRQCNSEVMQ
jgi:hypothetical protein